MPQVQFWSIKDVAEYLGVEYKTVYRLIRQGELPAGKIGGVYRIRKEDVDAYFSQQMYQISNEDESSPAASEAQKCSICSRLLHDARDVGGRCQVEGCEAPICNHCWEPEKRHHCLEHQPSPSERLQAAQQRLTAGELDLLVTAQEARRREAGFISRFDAKVHRVTKLWHPQREQIITAPPSWDRVHTTSDDAQLLMRLLQTGFLEREVEQRLPLNKVSRYLIPAATNTLGLLLEARVCAHLPALVEQGFDTEPATLAYLEETLDAAAQEAERLKVAYLVGLASPTGWTTQAEAYIAGGKTGRAFFHRLVLPCLVDLEAMRLVFDQNDPRIAPLASLFLPRLPEEELHRIIERIEQILLTSHGASVAELVHGTGLEERLVLQAFDHLIEKGTHRVEDIPDIGKVIVQCIE